MAVNFFDGLLTGQQFNSNTQSQLLRANELGFSNLDVANEFEFLGRSAQGQSFAEIAAQSSNPYVRQRAISNQFSNIAAQNQIAAQQANLQLSQAIAAQINGRTQNNTFAAPNPQVMDRMLLNALNPVPQATGIDGVDTTRTGSTANDPLTAYKALFGTSGISQV